MVVMRVESSKFRYGSKIFGYPPYPSALLSLDEGLSQYGTRLSPGRGDAIISGSADPNCGRGFSAVAGAAACRVRNRRRIGHRPAGRSRAVPGRRAANDDDRIIAVCGALIDNEKTAEGRPHQGADRARRRLRPQGPDRPRHRRLRHGAAARSRARRYLQRQRRALAQARATGPRRSPISAPRSS